MSHKSRNPVTRREALRRARHRLVGAQVWREQEREADPGLLFERPCLDRRAHADQQNMTATQYAIVAPTKVLAAENLKQRLTRLANGVGGSVQTIAELPAEGPEGWVRVRADMQLTMSQLYKSLNRLENEAPYVVVGYVSVVADRAVQTGHLATMDVRIEVSAPVRSGQSS